MASTQRRSRGCCASAGFFSCLWHRITRITRRIWSGTIRSDTMKWITRERPKVGRLGCAWLIRRFIDPEAEFYFVAGKDVRAEAERLDATPFHADGAELSRQGDVSSVEVVMRRYGLESDPALALLGRIVN